MSKYGVFSGPYFLAFRLNTERYGVSLCILSECRKIRTRKAPYFDTFHAVYVTSTHSRTEINYLAYSKNRFENNDTCYQNLRILLFLSKLFYCTDICRFICSHLSKRWDARKRFMSKSETSIIAGRILFANSDDAIETTSFEEIAVDRLL